MKIFKKIKDTFKPNKKTFDEGLTKVKRNFWGKFFSLQNKYESMNEEFFVELEEILIEADFGVRPTILFVENLRQEVKEEKIKDKKELLKRIYDDLKERYGKSPELNYNDEETIYLFVGVNGVGKTTTIAKMAKRFKDEGKKVLLIAGDTFRAGAVEQLEIWANRLDVGFFKDASRKDSASLIYDGIDYGREKGFEVILIDTAGRLQNKNNLMKELEKVHRVITQKIEKEIDEIFLVIDATAGQNSLVQAKEFLKFIPITSVILTKVDGTAKGGIIFQVKDELNLPVMFVGLGEKAEDLQLFNLDYYLDGFFGDIDE